MVVHVARGRRYGGLSDTAGEFYKKSDKPKVSGSENAFFCGNSIFFFGSHRGKFRVFPPKMIAFTFIRCPMFDPPIGF